MLAQLDNEVIFKKAFTDKEVFTGFVKDVLGIDITVDKIETEKRFKPRVGHIDFKLDIFAESTDERVVIEIQRIDYDHNFDRFLHYFMMSIAELQRKYDAYNISRVVYGIVVLTAPYTVTDSDHRPVKNEVLISKLNPYNLKGEEIKIFNHRLVFLNAYYRDPETPAAIRDWLDLIYQSIHHSESPNINLDNPLIKKVAGIISVDNLTPEETEARKIAGSRKITLQIREQKKFTEGKQEGLEEGKKEGQKEGLTLTLKVISLIKEGKTNEEIATITHLSIEEIQLIRESV